MLGCLIAAIGCNGVNSTEGPARLAARSPPSILGTTPGAHLLLVATSSKVDMGEVPKGGRKEITFSLANQGTRAVELARIESSCPCLTVDVARRIAPSEQVLATAKLDLHSEPNFTGELAIEVKGQTDAGDCAFAVLVDVKVPRNTER